MTPLPSLPVLSLPILLLASLASASGQTSVQCNVTAVVSWASNKEGQSPCQIAANLGAVCASSGQYNILPLSPAYGSYYTPSNSPSPCECSSVLYSLTAACGLCQGAGYTNWPTWTANCSAISPGTFPSPIPSGTFVPKWAYIDVTTSNSFNPTQAQSIGDGVESSAPASPSPTVKPTSSSSHSTSGAGNVHSSTASSPAHSSISPSPSPPSSNHAGAIAGGVVGGILGLAVVAGIAFFILSRTRKRRISVISPPIIQNDDDKDYPLSSPYHSSPHLETRSHSGPVMNITNSRTSPHNRPYDYNDSTAYPQTPASSGHSPQAGPSRTYNYSPPHHSAHDQRHTGAYSGFAEI